MNRAAFPLTVSPRARLRTTLRLAAAGFVCLLLIIGQYSLMRLTASPTPRMATPGALTKPAPLSVAQLAAAHVNELGVIPILLYQEISTRARATSRTPAQFRADLERLYREGYRPLSLRAYLDNRIDTPFGFSPVIITFDGGRESQYRLRTDGTVDPDCAVGIWQAFAKQHPDFPFRATFYPRPVSPFGPSEDAPRKFEQLLAAGCEIGNSARADVDLSRMPDQQIQRELATSMVRLQRYVAQDNVELDTLALPDGALPRHQTLLQWGTYQEIHYAFRGILKTGASPARSPVSRRFDATSIPRIVAINGEFGLDDWLNRLKKNPSRRYISDGDPATVSIPRNLQSYLASNQLQGATLRVY